MSDIPLFSGIEYRIFIWIVINTVGFIYILRYAAKIHKNPKKSVVYNDDKFWRKRNDETNLELEKTEPKAAWITLIVLSIALILFSIYFTQSHIKFGNTEITIPILPISTAFLMYRIRCRIWEKWDRLE